MILSLAWSTLAFGLVKIISLSVISHYHDVHSTVLGDFLLILIDCDVLSFHKQETECDSTKC